MENYTYMTLLTNNTYVQGVILLNETLKQVKSKYPLVVLVTNEIAQATLDILDYLKIKWKLVENVQLSHNIENFQEHQLKTKENNPLWKNVNFKFQIFNQIEYDKIIYLDCDIFILKNIDFLFKKPHMTASFNFYFYKFPIFINNKYYSFDLNNIEGKPAKAINRFNGGCLIINPSQELFNNIINFINNINLNDIPKDMILHEEDLLNLYYKTWKDQKKLQLNKYFNVFYFYNTEKQLSNYIESHAFFVHFLGSIKPWDCYSKLFKNKLNINNDLSFPSPLYQKSIKIIEDILLSLPYQLIINFTKIYLKEIEG